MIKAKTKRIPASPKPATKPDTKCRAAEVGHRSCKCGGPYCGENTQRR